MITAELVALGTVAGLTIFLGLPVAVMKRVSAKAKGFLNAITIGVLIFLLIEVLPTAKDLTERAITGSTGNSLSTGYSFVAALVIGLVLGMFGLVAYEMRFIKFKLRKRNLGNGDLAGPSNNKRLSDSKQKSIGLGEAEAVGATSSEIIFSKQSVQMLTFGADEARRIAFTIALGIGVHNFTEGLAIGQSFAFAQLSLSYLLIIGFAIHNSTEGFGIAAPMAGYRPSLTYLAGLGFIGGIPTLLGTVAGAVWPATPIALTFILAVAAGALIYIISGMFYVARRQTSNELFMLGLFLGFLIAYASDLWLVLVNA